jgi:hypothetical protein
VLAALVPLDITPRARRALVERGAAVHAVGHALGVGVGEVGRAAAAVVDAADAQEAAGRAGDMVDGVV